MCTLANGWRILAAAPLLEAALYALVIMFPRAAWLFIPVLAPGFLLEFFIGGGMSMIDGVAPEWRADTAFALGFLLNTIILWGFCTVVTRIAKDLRSVPR